MAKFNKYLKEKSLQRTMIGFGVDNPPKLNRLAEYIESWFIRYNVSYEPIEHKHISIAQITDRVKKDELIRIVNAISPRPFEFNVKQIVVLKGREWDFLALELKRSKEYLDLHNQIKEKYNVVEFPGGMKPHISLIKFEGGFASPDFMYDVIADAPVPKRIRAKKRDLWNPKFQIDYIKRR